MCVCMYVCMYVYIYIYIYTHICMYLVVTYTRHAAEARRHGGRLGVEGGGPDGGRAILHYISCTIVYYMSTILCYNSMS